MRSGQVINKQNPYREHKGQCTPKRPVQHLKYLLSFQTLEVKNGKRVSDTMWVMLEERRRSRGKAVCCVCRRSIRKRWLMRGQGKLCHVGCFIMRSLIADRRGSADVLYQSGETYLTVQRRKQKEHDAFWGELPCERRERIGKKRWSDEGRTKRDNAILMLDLLD